MANIVKPNDFTVRRVKERHTELALVARLLKNRTGIALGLWEHTLRSKRELLRFDNTTDAAAIAKRVISGAGRGGQFRHS